MSTLSPNIDPIPSQQSVGIHGNTTFLNFEYSFFTFPMLLLFVPLIYMPITVIIILRILVKLIFAVQDRNGNVQLFSVISMSQSMCLISFIADIFYVRLPTTGIFTRWCASVQPNRYLTVLFIFTYHINYSSMIFPFLVSTMRLILLYYSTKHRQLVNNYSLLFNTLFWMTACLINNSIIFVELLKSRCSLTSHARSQHSYKSARSLTLTTFSMILSFLPNGMTVISSFLFPNYSYFAIMLRPFGNDLNTCVVPWVFYLTHPVFRKKIVRKIIIFRPGA